MNSRHAVLVIALKAADVGIAVDTGFRPGRV